MIPFSITNEQAAAPHSSLAFMFWGEGLLSSVDAALYRDQLQRLQGQDQANYRSLLAGSAVTAFLQRKGS
jgi:hypothetical protein